MNEKEQKVNQDIHSYESYAYAHKCISLMLIHDQMTYELIKFLYCTAYE